MCEVDAFLAFKHFTTDPALKKLSLASFTEELAEQLLSYSTCNESRGPASRLRQRESQQTEDSDATTMAYDLETQVETQVGRCMNSHTLRSDIRSSSVFRYSRKKRRSVDEADDDDDDAEESQSALPLQRKCSVCKARRTTFYCEQCSIQNGYVVPICNRIRSEDHPGTPCIVLHVDKMSQSLL